MQNPRIHVMKSLFFVTLAALSVHAQSTLRCDLLSKGIDTTIGGQVTPQCLNLNTLNNDTLTLPSNVTRLDNQGLTLCTPSIDSSGGQADIVFAMDEGNTMGLGAVYLDTINRVIDTTYYWGADGCPPGSTITNIYTFPANVYGYFNLNTPNGIVQVAQLKSNAGCSDTSGDPFKVRAIAVKAAIDSIYTLSNVSNKSTIGYIPFAAQAIEDSKTHTQHPIPLTADTVAILQNAVQIDSLGGKNFNRPLDSAKQWLDGPPGSPPGTQNYGKTKNRAIVFISDGAQGHSNNGDADSNGLLQYSTQLQPVYGKYQYLDTNIHVFGILLAQKATSDTIILDSICKITHGQFFRVPPNSPDSLAGIIKLILHKIIRTYVPDSVTVTNTANGQTSRAAGAAAFLNQGKNLSYQILLDSALGLKNNVVNPITLTSKFQEVDSANITQSNTTKFWLRTTNPPSGNTLLPANLLTQCFQPTTIRWLQASGIRPAYFTDADSSGVQVQIGSSNNGLTTAHPTLKALINLDSLVPSLPNSFSTTTDTSFFASAIPLTYGVSGSHPLKSGTLGTAVDDSLTATWIHPRDPQDIAHDAIGIHPTNIQATAYFSTDSTGKIDTSEFPITATVAYLIVKDERGDTVHYAYQAIVTTSKDGDKETFRLTQSSPGVFYARIPLAKTQTPTVGDHTIQFSPNGDQMAATYVDPVYGDEAFANAGIGESVIFQSSLVFTDSLGNQLPSGTNASLPLEIFWSLAHNKVYLKHTDNNTIPPLASIPVQITATSLKLGQSVGQDVEQATLATRTTINNAVATWSGTLPLAESISPVIHNGTLEGAWRIEVVATDSAHDSTGKTTGQVDTAKLAIAWPDSLPSLSFKDTVNASDSLGPTSVYLTLKDQDFVHNSTSEAITATALCSGSPSGDSVTGLSFTQSAPGGFYTSGLLVRNTQIPNLQDGILSCPGDSGIVVHYTDPVYSTLSQFAIAQAQTPVANPPGEPFTSAVNISLQTSTAGARINYTLDSSFITPTLLPRPGHPLLYSHSLFIDSSFVLRAVASDTATVPRFLRSQVSSNRYLKQPVARGYAKDFNRDGIADDVVLVFQQPIANQVPASIDSLYWNAKTAENRRSADTTSHTLSLTDSLTLMAAPNPSFVSYVTGLPADTTNPPAMVNFPLGGYFNGLQVDLDDSVGPVAAMAKKSPSDLRTVAGVVDPDTLIITASEPLDSLPGVNPWQGLFRFRTGVTCSDTGTYRNSQTIPTLSEVADSIHFKDTTVGGVQQPMFRFLVNPQGGVAVPQLGDCIYLEANAGFTDIHGNLPGLVGVTLAGAESPVTISNMAGYPPVAGLAPGTATFKADNGTTAFQWIAPVGFPSNWTAGTLYTPTVTVTLNDSAAPSAVDPTPITTIPNGISTLQVVTAGKYIAHVHLTDNLGRFVKSWEQQFGFNGELSNPNRTSGSGKLSYLTWDERDSRGQFAGQGVYVWNVIFETPKGQQIMVTRTGLVR